MTNGIVLKFVTYTKWSNLAVKPNIYYSSEFHSNIKYFCHRGAGTRYYNTSFIRSTMKMSRIRFFMRIVTSTFSHTFHAARQNNKKNSSTQNFNPNQKIVPRTDTVSKINRFVGDRPRSDLDPTRDPRREKTGPLSRNDKAHIQKNPPKTARVLFGVRERDSERGKRRLPNARERDVDSSPVRRCPRAPVEPATPTGRPHNLKARVSRSRRRCSALRAPCPPGAPRPRGPAVRERAPRPRRAHD